MNKKEFICEYCSKKFLRYAPPSSKGTYQFCSPSCRNKARTLKDIPCPICGKMFKPKIVDVERCRRKHCSTECANKASIGRLSPKRTPQHIVDTVVKLYPENGAKYLSNMLNMSPSAIRQIAHKNNVKLNKDVYYKRVHLAAKKYMTKNNPMFTEKSKKKVKEWRKNNPEKVKEINEKLLISNRKIQKGKPTKLELKLFSILDKFKIEYEPFSIIKPKFIVDVKIGNVIIQADGEYWHGHPRFEPLTDRQKAQIKRDRSQDAYLKKCGYTVVRIWEREMTTEKVYSILEKYNLLETSD